MFGQVVLLVQTDPVLVANADDSDDESLPCKLLRCPSCPVPEVLSKRADNVYRYDFVMHLPVPRALDRSTTVYMLADELALRGHRHFPRARSWLPGHVTVRWPDQSQRSACTSGTISTSSYMPFRADECFSAQRDGAGTQLRRRLRALWRRTAWHQVRPSALLGSSCAVHPCSHGGVSLGLPEPQPQR